MIRETRANIDFPKSGYEKGATMDYEGLGPARQVMPFLGNDTFANLSPAGLPLFDAAGGGVIGGR